MNANIRRLVEQSDGIVYDDDGAELVPMLIGDKIDTFTQLVVQECVRAMQEVGPGYRDYRVQIEDGMRDACIEAIMKKFGVTE